MQATLGELATRFGCDLVGDPQIRVTHVATLANADPTSLTFLANPAYRKDLKATRAAAVVLCAEHAKECPVAALISTEPYTTYAFMANVLHPPEAVVGSVHQSAVIAASARVSERAQIAAKVVIGEETVVEAGASIGAGSVIGRRCRIGENTRLHAQVTLVEDVRIGRRCIVHPGAVIGCDGFGNARSDTGWVKVPQVGGVEIGDDVEIGANTTIDRGSIDDTVLENGVRLDNLIQIAHNVHIGEHTAMAAFSGVSGSTTIGKRCMFAGQTGVVGHVTICDDVIVGGATMVSKDIREPGFYTASFPAEKDRDWKRKVARFRRIEDLAQRLAKLERGDKKE